MSGFATTNTGKQMIPRVVPDGIATFGIGIGDFGATTFALHFGSSYSSRSNAYITIYYTKTA
jgi:hypothetical protein